MAIEIDTSTSVEVIDESEWRARAANHTSRAAQWTTEHLERRRRGIVHPVLDFLFDYYPYSPGRLSTWHPGVGFALAGPWSPLSNFSVYQEVDGVWMVDVAAVNQRRLRVALDILSGTSKHPPQFGCFGMHEWAMVYRAQPEDIRHSRQPLRMSVTEISSVVDHVGLRCTHIDAFRFFTEEAAPLNAARPTRDNQAMLEQGGCIHANMDLFKYAMWFQPYVPGDLVLDCFELALQARELDMRASPYDLDDFGYAAITIETSEGRTEYVKAQREISALAGPLRREVIASLERLTHAPSA